MPYDLDEARPGRRPSLREGALELMLRAQDGPGIDDDALHAELRRLVAASRGPTEDLWDAYSGRAPRRRLSRGDHAPVTIARA